MKNLCKNCGDTIKKGKGYGKYYCSVSCYSRYRYKNDEKERTRVKKNTKKRYERVKNTDEFKEQSKIRFKKWLNKNREHYNQYYRERYKLKGETKCQNIQN
jgi:hypothetical protein